MSIYCFDYKINFLVQKSYDISAQKNQRDLDRIGINPKELGIYRICQ